MAQHNQEIIKVCIPALTNMPTEPHNQEIIKVCIPALTKIPTEMLPASPTMCKTPRKLEIFDNALKSIDLQLVSAIFYQIFILPQMIALQKQ